MKKLHGVLASFSAACLIAGVAFAADEQQFQSYAHPTMFGSSEQQTISADSAYVVGGKILKSQNSKRVAGKENVAVNTWAKSVLDTIKDNTNEKIWNKNMPILRSELAVVLSEGLAIQKEAEIPYSDISSSYWAQKWIARALAADVMIGYPDKTFRPDQPVTKAEVFATIAKIVDVPIDRSALLPDFQGYEMQYIPRWAFAATKEVVKSDVLNNVPNPEKVASEEYLSKEQVAYLVGSLRSYLCNSQSSVTTTAGTYAPTQLTVKLNERLSARTSNVGDKFTAKTTEAAVLSGQAFEAGATVKGEVVEVVRPGVKNPGYLKVKFTEIVSDDCSLAFPKNLSEAEAATIKNPNFVARLFGAPFSAAARIVGVAGRTAGSGVDVIGNGLEQFGDNLSNTFVNTLSLQPVAGARSLGGSVITLGKGIYNIGKLAVSGVFGVLYEVTDEVKYLILPSASNNSSLNPGEELVIVY